MSVCISHEGEFGEHLATDEAEPFTCQRCFAFDEDAATAEIARLRAALGRVTALADLYDEAGRTRTVKPPWSHIATEIRNAARPSESSNSPAEGGGQS